MVLNIEPTRTILRDADSGCVVHVSNSDISQFIIKNYTQCRNLRRLEELQVGVGGSAAYPAADASQRCRQFTFRPPTLPAPAAVLPPPAQAAARGEGHPALMTMTELTVEMRSDKPRPGEGWDGAMPAAG